MQRQIAIQEEMEQRMAVQQILELRRRYWERLFLTTIDMTESELRAALKHRSVDQRFAAAYVVGERLLEWPQELIPLLEDKSEAVRQGARRSLIILSFLALNPEEARRIRSPQRNGVVTPLSELKKPVDFGPNPGDKALARAVAAKQWREWWAERGGQPTQADRELIASDHPAAQTEGERLAAALLGVAPERRPEIIAKYREQKGVQYTEALALATARASGEQRQQLREALGERLGRMTEKTLGQYLEDEDAEIRRAAALALAGKESKAHFGQLVGLLLDSQPIVERAAHAALCSLSGEDFGPRVNATEDEKTDAARRWRQWWASKK
jgi:HEAT repeat protein